MVVGLKGGSADNQTGDCVSRWTCGRTDGRVDAGSSAIVTLRSWRCDRVTLDSRPLSVTTGVAPNGATRSRTPSGNRTTPSFLSFKKSRLRQWYLGKVSTCLEFTQRYCHAVLLQPMNSGYLGLFDKMINYLSCSIQWQYTVWWLSWFLLISLTLLWINIGWINLTESK